MANMVYNVLETDKAMDTTHILVAFRAEQVAYDWLVDYIRENYSTEFDMNHEGIFLTVEPTILQ